MAKHRGESSKMGQAEPLPQVAVGGLQVQTRSQAVGAAHEERDSEQDKREVSSQEEAESRIDRVESLVDRLTEDTKDSVRHLHEVVAELTAKVTLLPRTLNAGGNNTRAAPS
ncbi:hypothetical protein BHM03_00021943 [Ensete ventricosum]|nr:hypothetical protein BHM03_00021943 [Ensete ventricosum]